jgi:hypothetical protein
MSNILELLRSPEPLSDEAIATVMVAREENTHVDFKLDLENTDREWLEVTKDVMAFANTEGGYLVFGVKNGTYEEVGLSDQSAKLISDTNNLMQKFNRCIEPHFTGLRAKAIQRNGKKFVIVMIPASLDATHMVCKEGAFKHQSVATKVVLHVGTFHVRRSGANHMADSRDLDAVLERRMARYREKLLQGISRVVAAPADREVLVVKREAADTGEEADAKYIIEDAPAGLKGRYFTPTPETVEQEIAMYVGINKVNPTELPTARMMWKWYEARDRVRLSVDQKIHVVAFSLRRGAPAFFWMQGRSGEELRETLGTILKVEKDPEAIANTLVVSMSLGKRFHKSQVAKLGAKAKLYGKDAVYPASDEPRSYWTDLLPRRRDRQELLDQLDAIAKSAKTEWDGLPSKADRLAARNIDAFLYGQDEYPNSRPEKVGELAT